MANASSVMRDQHEPVLVFSSQGGQWLGMGRRLYGQEPVFRSVLERCDREIRRYLDWSLLEEFTKDDKQYRLHDDSTCIQPTLTAVQVALSTLLRTYGVEATAVAGLSMGEVAATYIAGILDLEDAMKVVCCQAKLTTHELRRGRMAFINLNREQAQSRMKGREDRISIAVELSPDVTVLSGEASAVESLVSDLQEQGVHCGMVPVGFAFHSPEVHAVEQEFFKALGMLRPQPGSLPMYSSVMGDTQDGRNFGASHWWRIMSSPAYFSTLVKSLLRDGYRTFIEVGPHPILVDSIRQTAQLVGTEVSTFVVMSREQDDYASFHQMLPALGIRNSKTHG